MLGLFCKCRKLNDAGGFKIRKKKIPFSITSVLLNVTSDFKVPGD